MIPKRIFQTWKSHDLPEQFRYWSETLKVMNPTYEHVLWDDAQNRDFIEKNFNWFLPIYDGFPAEIYRADAVRYFFLYSFGGIYADLDVECLKPLDNLIGHREIVLGRMGTIPEFEHSIPNAFMASAPHEDFWLLVISLIMDAASAPIRPEYVTGPVILKRAHDLYVSGAPEVEGLIHRVKSMVGSNPCARSAIDLMHGHLIFPLNWSDGVHEMLRRHVLKSDECLRPEAAKAFFPQAYVVTYWSHSWEEQNL